jgi:glucose/arabinose dehydrogenase
MKKLFLSLLFVLFVPILASAQSYTETQYTTGLSMPVSMAFTPDGRIFVAEKSGKLRVIKKDGTLVATPSLTLNVSANSERGLLGVALDPNFSTNKYVYLYYTRESFPVKNRLSRFTVSASNPDLIDANSEKVLIDDIASDAGNHNGGAIHFGKDGKLYVAVGDGGQLSSNGQALNTLSGKILRINSDGTIPTDNPFYNVAGAKKEIWAYGFRNPFTFAIDQTSGMIHVNDVGQSTWEEVNMVEKGGNYGWPICEGAKNTGRGFCINNEFKYPIHVYDHSGAGKSITAGAFYKGDYYFGDYVGNFIKKLDKTNSVSDFVTAKSPIDIDVGPDNNLYYLSLLSGKVFKLSQNTTPVHGLCGAIINTCSAGTLLDTADTSTLTQWSCVGTNGGSTNACSAVFSTNKPPVSTITSPTANSKYNAGQVITVTGTGIDPEEGTLPASAFSWTVVFYHDTHTHPFLGPITGKNTETFTIPTTGETAHNVWYRIYLTTTDSDGAKSEVYRDIYPNVVDLIFKTEPAELPMTIDGQPQFTPHTVKSVVGMTRSININDIQVDNDMYVFNSWSDNKARSHDITTPSTNTVYTATLNQIKAQSVTFIPHYGSGDFAIHLQKEIDDRISGVLSGLTTRSMWNTQGSDKLPWDRNPNTILNRGQRALNLGGQSVWNSLGQYKRSGTLVSPRHMIFAKHFSLAKDTVVVFVGPNNEIITRTVTKVELSPTNDLGVALLDRDVPDTIPFYPVVPRADWDKYLKGIDGNIDIPILYLNQNDRVGVHVVKAGQFYSNSINMAHAKAEGKRAEFDEPVISGDSGNPAFAIIGGQPVLLFTHFDQTRGPNLATHFNEINAMMTKLGGRYQLSTVDLRDFIPAQPSTGKNRAPTAEALDIQVTGLVTTINFIGADPDGDPLIFATGRAPINGTLKKVTETQYTYTLTSLPNTAFVDGFNYYSSDKKQTSPAVRVTLRYTPPGTNLDADGDGVLLPTDKCPNTPANLRTQVNKAGCVRPKQTKFNTKPIVEDDIKSVPNVELGINNVGKIKFKEPVALARDNAALDLDTNVIIEQDKVEIKSSVIPELNKPATITLYNINETNPRILKNGEVCPEPQCKIESFTNGTLVFTVTGFSVYTIDETPEVTPETEPEKKKKSGSGGGGGGGNNTVISTQSNEILIAQLTAQLNILIAELNRLTGGSTVTGALTKTLSIGSRDPQVKTLQQLLNKKGVTISTTGYYGVQTQAAVKKFQASKGIATTGTVGPQTRAALNN